MTLIEEIKEIFKNRPKHKSKDQKTGDAVATYADNKSMRHAAKISLYPKDKKYRAALIVMTLIANVVLVMLILVDILPDDLIFILIAAILASLILCSALFASKIKRKRIYGIVLAVIFVILLGTSISYMSSTFSMLNKISDSEISNTSKGPAAKKVGVTEDAFNVYITGIDQFARYKGEDLERSDVNMLVTVNPVTKKILLTSIPRDTYVELYTAKQMDKLTHTGVYGVDETLNTVEKWLGIDLNYYIKMNFTGAVAVIDAIGGVDVYSPVEFRSSLKGYKYKKGWNHLRGKKALYFARERKSFEGQDSVRVENQQRVLKSIIKKMTTSTTLLTKYGSIMEVAGDNLETNMSSSEMQKLVKMQIAELASWDVQTQKVEGEVDQDYVASLTQSMKFDIYRPSEESVRKCVENIISVLSPGEEEIKEARQGRNRSFLINAVKRAITSSKEEPEE